MAKVISPSSEPSGGPMTIGCCTYGFMTSLASMQAETECCGDFKPDLLQLLASFDVRDTPDCEKWFLESPVWAEFVAWSTGSADGKHHLNPRGRVNVRDHARMTLRVCLFRSVSSAASRVTLACFWCGGREHRIHELARQSEARRQPDNALLLAPFVVRHDHPRDCRASFRRAAEVG